MWVQEALALISLIGLHERDPFASCIDDYVFTDSLCRSALRRNAFRAIELKTLPALGWPDSLH